MIPPVLLLFKQIPTKYEGNDCLLMDNPFFNLEKSNFYSELVGAVMYPIKSISGFSKLEKKICFKKNRVRSSYTRNTFILSKVKLIKEGHSWSKAVT